ncbi:phosphate signaling complex protein PhoU [Halobacterium jilantaiense]|uniref:Phosphate-specific transport system accessory protein PhoU n=1 Tax=Halobacterium jilantaiense TaxID=355548 RepID=A0A1I0PJK2_9EURY|nr:phosphate signaling complex protein PhoU [Halobacterium jilantaiense]SEW14614.1 phosphate transport system protein [Halobacterium jilantaiense]
MPRDTYQAALDDLRADVVAMGELVLSRLDDALAALTDGDEAAARAVVDGDDEVNDRYLALEADCVDLFALQQPVAGDLRFVASSFKVLTDLERVGDLAVNLATYALDTRDDHVSDVDLGGIGVAVRDLFADAVEAYADGDPDACRELAARDDEVDALCQQAGERIVRDLVERGGGDDGPWAVEAVLDDVSRLLLSVRDLERIADHGVNVAARTLYDIESDPELVY